MCREEVPSFIAIALNKKFGLVILLGNVPFADCNISSGIAIRVVFNLPMESIGFPIQWLSIMCCQYPLESNSSLISFIQISKGQHDDIGLESETMVSRSHLSPQSEIAYCLIQVNA